MIAVTKRSAVHQIRSYRWHPSSQYYAVYAGSQFATKKYTYIPRWIWVRTSAMADSRCATVRETSCLHAALYTPSQACLLLFKYSTFLRIFHGSTCPIKLSLSRASSPSCCLARSFANLTRTCGAAPNHPFPAAGLSEAFPALSPPDDRGFDAWSREKNARALADLGAQAAPRRALVPLRTRILHRELY